MLTVSSVLLRGMDAVIKKQRTSADIVLKYFVYDILQFSLPSGAEINIL